MNDLMRESVLPTHLLVLHLLRTRAPYTIQFSGCGEEEEGEVMGDGQLRHADTPTHAHTPIRPEFVMVRKEPIDFSCV